MNYFINADDFGLSKEVNDAILYCFKNQLINSASLMVNTDCTLEAIEIARDNHLLSNLRIHLNLTHGKPLTKDIVNTMFCTDGVFNGNIRRGRCRFFLFPREKKAIKTEIIAQIEMFKSIGINNICLDSHHHIHVLPSIFHLILSISREMHIEYIRPSRNIPNGNFTLMKTFLKKYINKKIVKFNKKSFSNCYSQIIYFGSMNDYDIEVKQETDVCANNTEIMCHPILKSDVLKDAVANMDVGTFILSKANRV